MSKPVFVKVDTSKWYGWITPLPDRTKFSPITCTHNVKFLEYTQPVVEKGQPRLAIVVPFKERV